MSRESELIEEIQTKIESKHLICDEVNKKIEALEDLLKSSGLRSFRYDVCLNWGTMIFYVYWNHDKKRLMGFTEDGDKPIAEHRIEERMEFFRHYIPFLEALNEAL